MGWYFPTLGLALACVLLSFGGLETLNLACFYSDHCYKPNPQMHLPVRLFVLVSLPLNGLILVFM